MNKDIDLLARLAADVGRQAHILFEGRHADSEAYATHLQDLADAIRRLNIGIEVTRRQHNLPV